MNELSAAHPARFGPYVVERTIGHGGMAVVYEAVHERLGRAVAIKVLHLFAAHEAGIARFEREARIVGTLRHPHIVEALDLGVQDGQPYLVMELVRGETLATLLRRRRRLPLDEIASIFLPICAAVAAAHAQGIVHRDLKPANVMLAGGDVGRTHPKVLDFGISRSDSDAPLTRSDAVVGTVHYLSPEQARGRRDVTPRSDIYSLGVMLFQCATGELPFDGEGSYEVMHAIVTKRTPPPSARCAGLPAAFDAIVLRALERDPAERLDSAIALGRALLPFADEGTRLRWAPTFAAAMASQVARSLEGTATDDHPVTAFPSLIRAPSGWMSAARRARWVAAVACALGVAALVLAALGARPSRAQKEGHREASPVATVASAPPAIAPSASAAPQDLARPVVPLAEARAVAPRRADDSHARHSRVDAAALADAPAASAAPVVESPHPSRRGANGALILE